MIDTFPCPKCNRRLCRSGEIEIEGTTFPVFQCDECSKPWKVEGEILETALTFAVNAEGEPFDPASDDWELHL